LALAWRILQWSLVQREGEEEEEEDDDEEEEELSLAGAQMPIFTQWTPVG